MIRITPTAANLLAELFHPHGISPVRIVLFTGGCGIRFFSLQMEESGEDGHCLEIGPYALSITPALLVEYGPITVDSDGISFLISGSGIAPPYGCGTCAFGCGTRGKLRCSGNCRTCPTPCTAARRRLKEHRRSQHCM